MELSPETIRVMLTGNPDQRTAIDAINQGEVFRFLSKPASITALTAVINEALHRHNVSIR